MSSTAIEKILARASGRSAVRAGDIVFPDPELVIVHDGYVVAARRELDSLGIDRVFDPERVMFVTDHEVLYASQAAAERAKGIRDTARYWGIRRFHDAGSGGHGHLMPMETGDVLPGSFHFAYDMHCTNFGAIGALVLRTGAEVTTVLATGTLWTKVPPVVKVILKGKMQPGVYARDIGFRLAHDLVSRQLNVDPDYRAFEFAGPGLAGLGRSERIALCNSITEIGACATFFPPDGEILEWCRSRATRPFEPVYSDPDAHFQATIEIDLDRLEPQVALPGGPANAASLASVIGRKVQHTYIGSCGSGTFEDMEAGARILRGRRVAPGTRLLVTPGTVAVSRQMRDEGLFRIYEDAGAIILPAGCGPCAGGAMGQLASGETSICTAATNNAGRMGAKDAEIFLASPATVAASAIAGQITDPRQFLQDPGDSL